MNKIDQLWIRACKSGASKSRLLSVYRRFYLRSAYTNVRRDEWIANILMNLCDKYCPIPAFRALDEMSPGCNWKYEGMDYYQRVIAVLSSHIALTEVSKFPGLTAPLIFRRRETIRQIAIENATNAGLLIPA